MSNTGRPPFEPTQEHRERVSIAASGGLTHDVIAAAIGISVPTLRKYFSDELTAGACGKRVEVLEALHAAAMRGNVTAQRAILAMPEPRGIAPPAEPEGDVQKPEGKKAQANAEAVVAQRGTEWEDLLGTTATPQ